MDILIVDFKVRTPEEVFAGGCASDVSKNVLHSTRNDTGLVLITTLHHDLSTSGDSGGRDTHQSERLARGCLTIGEDDSVVSVHGSTDVTSGDGVVHRLVL